MKNAKRIWNKFRHWIFKILGGVPDEYFKKYMREYAEIDSQQKKEIDNLRKQLIAYYPPAIENNVVTVKCHRVEPVVLQQMYELRSFDWEKTEQEKIIKSIQDHLIHKISQDIVSHRLFKVEWCDDNLTTMARQAKVTVRIVPPIENRQEGRR